MKLAETHIVPENVAPTRLSDYGGRIFLQIPSRKGVKKAISKGLVFVNKKKGQTATLVQSGDQIDLYMDHSSKLVFKLKVEVVYEDDYLAVINKPAGILVNGNSFRTVENALPYNLKESSQKDALVWPQTAHRLDYGTSGLLLTAKSMSASISLKEMFKQRQIKKTYVAMTTGHMTPRLGRIDEPVDDKQAITFYEVANSVASNKYGAINQLVLYPETGRKHQIRRHLSHIGHPILGDRDYGTSKLWDMKKGLYLQASEVSFVHPFTYEMLKFSLELPRKFQKLLKSQK